MGTNIRRGHTLEAHEQALLMEEFRSFRTRVRLGTMVAIGVLQPNPLTEQYHVRIEYTVGRPPDIRVISPKLTCRAGAHSIPHMYEQDRLCVYLPNSGEWSNDMPLGRTFIPWISLWLLYYELWHATGTWLGGGIEPNEYNDVIKSRKPSKYECIRF